MPRRKVYLVSPREPSGATWLINCLLELGVMTFRYSPAGMWRREGGRWLLNPHERVLRKWLPALSDHASFDFRDDLEVQWMHEWFTDEFAGNEVLYFVRDPRDALYSRYMREAPRLSYREFTEFPDVYTLLDKVTNWWLYSATWLTHPRLRVIRFEDYKANAGATLARVLDALRLGCDSTSIENAVRSSTFERAAAAESAYRAQQPDDTQLINRSGKPGEWQGGAMDAAVVQRIDSACGDLLERFRYPHSSAASHPPALGRHAARLSFFARLKGLNAAPLRGLDSAPDQAAPAVLLFAATLNADLLQRACLPAHELEQLHASLREYLGRLDGDVTAAIRAAVPTASSTDDPVGFPLSRLRRGLLRHVRRILGSGA